MEIKLNDITDVTKQSDIISLSNCPTIIEVSPTPIGIANDKFAYRKMNCTNIKLSDSSKEGKIFINGNAIIATNDIKKVKGNRFYLNGTPTEMTTFSIVQALKNISNIDLNYNIKKEGEFDFSVTAKEYGSKYNIDISTQNISNLFTTEQGEGKVTNELIGTYSSKVYCDLYYNNGSHRKIKEEKEETKWTFLTTLNKEFYRDNVKFDVTTPFQSVIVNDNMILWKADIYAQVDDNILDKQTIDNNYIIDGYDVNNINNINVKDNSIRLTHPLINLGKNEDGKLIRDNIDGGDKLYIYSPLLPITLLLSKSTVDINFTIQYLSIDGRLIHAQSQKINLTTSNKDFINYNIELNEEKLRESSRIRLIDYEGLWNIEYNVIQLPNSNSECNRINWKNSFGGLSFFDFVGEKQTERKIKSTTYYIPTLDYFDLDGIKTEVVYDKELEKSATLTTHLIPKEGINQLYDLEMSRVAWIEDNGTRIYVTIESLEVEELNENVFRAKIKYKY